MTIKINIQGQEVELTPKEAQALYDDLAKMFQSRAERKIVVKAPERSPEPIYIPIVYPVPSQPPQYRPPSGPWCDDGYPRVIYGDPFPCPQTICEGVA